MTDAIKALLKAQTEMGVALKKASNPHLKSKYADLGAVMEACMDAFHANGFAVLQPSGADEHGSYVETNLHHETGERFTSRIYLVLGKQDMQAVGSAQTYARRYGLLGMAGLAPEDDDGHATKRAPKQDIDPAPEFDPAAARDRIKKRFTGAKTLPDLRDAWVDEQATMSELPQPMQGELEKVKNDRKTALGAGSAQAPEVG